jgi:hypothetical protein
VIAAAAAAAADPRTPSPRSLCVFSGNYSINVTRSLGDVISIQLQTKGGYNDIQPFAPLVSRTPRVDMADM